MIKDHLKRLAAVGVMLVCLIFISLVWYAHLILKRVDIYSTIFVSLLFGGGILVELAYVTATRYEERWFILDPRYLRKSQNIVLGIGALFIAGCSLWLAVSKEISVFLQNTVQQALLYIVVKVVFVVGFFYFSWHAIRRFEK